MSAHCLRLNDLVFSAGDGGAVDTDGQWWWDVYGADFTTGSAEAIEITMRTLLQDGARVITQGYGTREVTFYAIVGGVDSLALAEAEKSLALQMGRRGVLGWTPPDGWGPESVFDVETSTMTSGGPGEDADLRELEHNERVYQLRFVCQPFARTTEAVVVPAVAVPVAALSETVVDAGSSLTRWTARIGTISDAGSYLQVAGSRSPRAAFTPAAPVSLATKPYISLVSQFGGTPHCSVNGVRAALVGSESASISGSAATRYFWHTDETSLVSAEWGTDVAASSSVVPLVFNDLRIRNLPLFSGTLRQSRRSIEVAGSVRTQGTLQLAAPVSEALGTVVFYSTAQAANAPSLRGYTAPGAANPPGANADAVSGFVQFLGSPISFDVPVSDLAAGKCQILARLSKPFGSTSTAAISWSAQTMVSGAAVGPQVAGVGPAVTLNLNEFKVVALGTVDLPTIDLPAESQAIVRITLVGSHHYDEAWLLNLDAGAVTVVEAGAHGRVWIETATTERPRPAIYVGDNADRTDAFHDPALVAAWGVHEFAPPLTTALVVTSGCEAPDVTFEFFPRYMNFVA